MQPDKIIKKYKEMFDDLEEYDRTRELPFGRKRIDITLDRKLIKRLKSFSGAASKPVSRVVEDALNAYLKSRHGNPRSPG